MLRHRRRLDAIMLAGRHRPAFRLPFARHQEAL
jgi:hypothetical protein